MTTPEERARVRAALAATQPWYYRGPVRGDAACHLTDAGGNVLATFFPPPGPVCESPRLDGNGALANAVCAHALRELAGRILDERDELERKWQEAWEIANGHRQQLSDRDQEIVALRQALAAARDSDRLGRQAASGEPERVRELARENARLEKANRLLREDVRRGESLWMQTARRMLFEAIDKQSTEIAALKASLRERGEQLREEADAHQQSLMRPAATGEGDEGHAAAAKWRERCFAAWRERDALLRADEGRRRAAQQELDALRAEAAGLKGSDSSPGVFRVQWRHPRSDWQDASHFENNFATFDAALDGLKRERARDDEVARNRGIRYRITEIRECPLPQPESAVVNDQAVS